MKMTVKGFSEKYQISPQAVYAKIRKKKNSLDGHITKSGGRLVFDEYAEELLKPKCADFTLLEKLKNIQKQLDVKISECEKMKISLNGEISKSKKLQIQLNDKTSENDILQKQFVEQCLKKSDFDNLAEILKSEFLKISNKIDDTQNSIFEITKKSSNGIMGLLKK